MTSIDAGETGVVIGGAGVAGVAGGTGVPFVGVTLCAEVFSLVVWSLALPSSCSHVLCVAFVCLVAALLFTHGVHASRERHPPRSAGLLPLEPLMALRVFPK